jgi:maltooligosyltrehalose trehalohydrolase
MDIGTTHLGDGRWRFTVWAGHPGKVTLCFPDLSAKDLPLIRLDHGYLQGEVNGLAPGTRYHYFLGDGQYRPDPASHDQPGGVHAPSALVDHDAFVWTDAGFRPRPPEETVLYELHVGTFTPEGTLDAALARIARIAGLGVSAVEIMPVSPFSGARNWGYDGVYPFAVHHGYGGPMAMKRFVDGCHRLGLSVILDLVMNHFGPEGCYLREFGPYFTDRYRTPWGDAINFDGPGSDGVRNYFVRCMLHWFTRYHVDGLRLDAVHAVHDESPEHILAEMARHRDVWTLRTGRPALLLAESETNDPGLITPRILGGRGLDGVWTDDFHHAVHVLLTGESDGYYRDFHGFPDVVAALEHGFVYRGGHSAFLDRRRGMCADHLPGHLFVVALQTHDQVGNRMRGERLAALVPAAACRLGAVLLLFSPYTPLLFMGEEYGEPAPFLYFVDHGDPDLARAVRQGRKREFACFARQGEPPDPAAVETFLGSRLRPALRRQEPHLWLYRLYRECLRLRRERPELRRADRQGMRVIPLWDREVVLLERVRGGNRTLIAANCSKREAALDPATFLHPGPWSRVLDTEDPCFGGTGLGFADTSSCRRLQPFQAAVFVQGNDR